GANTLAAARSDSVAAIYARHGEEAVATNVIGSPCYVLDGEVFWGQDRLDLVAGPLERGRKGYRMDATMRATKDCRLSFIIKTPKPPYYCVVFTSINADVDHSEHTAMYRRIVEVAQRYDGYLGIEPARNPDGSGVAAVYWKDHASILAFA